MKHKAALLFLMMLTNTLMILGTKIEERLTNGKSKPSQGTEKEDIPDFLFFASKLYL